MTYNLTQLTIRREEFRKLIVDENARHKTESERLGECLRETNELIGRFSAGLDNEQIELGLSVLELRGRFTDSGGEKESARQSAIADIAIHGGREMQTRTFGVKNYDRWTGQRCDCSYGMGPAHGWITFSVGLQPDARGRKLTPDETEAAIYCLYNLEAIEKARLESAAELAEAVS